MLLVALTLPLSQSLSKNTPGPYLICIKQIFKKHPNVTAYMNTHASNGIHTPSYWHSHISNYYIANSTWNRHPLKLVHTHPRMVCTPQLVHTPLKVVHTPLKVVHTSLKVVHTPLKLLHAHCRPQTGTLIPRICKHMPQICTHHLNWFTHTSNWNSLPLILIHTSQITT